MIWLASSLACLFRALAPLGSNARRSKAAHNLVEHFFGDLTEDVIRSGSFASVNELVRDIKAYLAERNADPKPYAWRAEGAEILAKIKRARAALDNAEAVM